MTQIHSNLIQAHTRAERTLCSPMGQTQKATICKRYPTALQMILSPSYEFQDDDHFLMQENAAKHCIFSNLLKNWQRTVKLISWADQTEDYQGLEELLECGENIVMAFSSLSIFQCNWQNMQFYVPKPPT